MAMTLPVSRCLSFLSTNYRQHVFQLNRYKGIAHTCCKRLLALGTTRAASALGTTSNQPSVFTQSYSEVPGVCQEIHRQVEGNSHGRLFAVVHMNSKQFKVTNDDLILLLTNEWFPDVGSRIVLEKVLCVGGKDFTLLGQPLLQNVRVQATVVEKTLSYNKIWFSYRRRKNSRRLNMTQDFQTVLRINSIEIDQVEQEEVD